MIIALSLLVAIIGVLVYALSTNAKVVELGKLAYFAGLLTFLFHAEEVVKILTRVRS